MEHSEARTRHFQEELEFLKQRLLVMGGLAEERVRMSMTALVDRDAALIENVVTGDEPINQLHLKIDNLAFTLLPFISPWRSTCG